MKMAELFFSEHAVFNLFLIGLENYSHSVPELFTLGFRVIIPTYQSEGERGEREREVS
jgi:hypothetical protein